MSMVLICLSQGLVFSFQELQKATENFSRPRAQNPQKSTNSICSKPLNDAWGAMVTNGKAEKPRSKRMGEGGFGAVYRGMQPDGTEIAVKAPLELGRGSTFVFVQTCPSCQHLRLKSHVQRPANLVYQKHASQFPNSWGFQKTSIEPGDRRGQTWTTFASLIDMSGVAECSRVRFRR